MNLIRLQISGMHCAACKISVLNAASKVGASGEVDVISGAAEFNSPVSANELIAAINEAGFSAILESAQSAKPLIYEFISALICLICSIVCLFVPFWPAFIICLFAVILGAGKFIKKALFHKAFGMDLLISLGIFINLLFSFILPHSYFFECSFIAFIVCFGKSTEAAAKRYATRLIAPSITPSVRLESGAIISAKDLKKGDILKLNAGDILHTDARLLNDASFDLAVISGESKLVFLKANSEVAAGAAALSECKCKALSEYSNSSLVKLKQIATKAASPSEYPWLQAAARYFSAVIISIAALSFVLWWVFDSLESAAFYASSVLLISCPCALALAVPMSISCGVARCFARQIIIKNSSVFQIIPDVLVCDKTGTLTKPTATINIADKDAKSLLKSAQNSFHHPIAKAVCEAINEPLIKCDESAKLVENNLIYGPLVCKSDEQGFKVFINDELAGRVDIKDSLNKGAKELAKAYKIVITSGDNIKAVANAANNLGAVAAFARCNAIDKALIIRSLRSGLDGFSGVREFSDEIKDELLKRPVINKLAKHTKIFYIGDGANDLACIRAADVSIALAHSHSALMAKAQAIAPSLEHINELLKISKLVRSKIRSNLIISFIYNILGISFASGVFVAASKFASFFNPLAAINLHINPALCATLMSASSLVVMGNSLLLLRQRD